MPEQPLSGRYDFLPVDRILFGPGSVSRLADEMDRLQMSKALLATTSSIAQMTPLSDTVRKIAGSRIAGVFVEIRQHTPSGAVDALRDQGRRIDADGFVSLGGGSVIDSTKAAAFALMPRHGQTLPHISLPTTLSASEFSHLFGVTDDRSRVKAGHASPAVTPRVVILDPDLTRYTPEWLWLSSGIRALDHAIETIYAPDHQPATDAPALEAIRLLFRYLGPSRDQSDLYARQQCQMAAWLSFFGVANITLGPSHLLGRQLGPKYNVPHGYTSAALLPAVMSYLLPATRRRQEMIADAIRSVLGSSGPTSAEDAAPAVREFIGSLGLPQRLRDLAVPREDLAALGQGRSDLHAILLSAW